MNLEQANARAQGFFPGYLGIVFTAVGHGEIEAVCAVRPELMAPNGYLHAGAALCLTIIGIPFGIAHFKIAQVSWAPLGKRIVDA